MEPTLQHKPSRRRLWLWMTAALALLFAAGAGGTAYYALYWPNSKHVKPDFGGMAKPIFYRGDRLSEPASGTKESLKLPFDLLKEHVDPSLFYEDASQSVIITTKDKVVRLRTSQLTGMMNEKPFTLRFPVEKSGALIYVPIDPLRDFYQFEARESADTGAVMLVKAGDVLQWAKPTAKAADAKHTVAVRTNTTIKAPIVAELSAGQRVMLWGDAGPNWYRVQLENGIVGYVQKGKLSLDGTETMPQTSAPSTYVPWKPLGGKINLTWQQITSVAKPVDTSKIGPMPGLNVISPQYFHLDDGDGNLKNLADPAYIKWAHDRGLQVWALFSNSFEPKRTSDALSNYDKRMKIIKQLVSYVQMYHLEGINIDFENVNVKDKPLMVQFVRELTPFLHEQNAVVSIDVTVKDGSENYSLFMDRKAIGEVVDYMMVMTYDEHWSTSPKSGSVASLPWVEKGLLQIMKEDAVPTQKLLLGVPFYTRIWTEQTKDGKPTSKTASMDAVQKIVKDKNLTPTLDADSGQNYVEYTEDGKLQRIWIEDAMSMKSRMELVKKYDLAGVASWSRGFETPDIWNVIKDSLDKRP